jgi:outer membrane protein TolC
LLLSLAALSACQTYRPRELDDHAFDRQWRSRLVDDPGVLAFAERLAVSSQPGAAGFDPADGISLAEAEAIALMFNPELRMARRKAGVTLARAANAGRWADPVLGIDAEHILQDVQHPWVIGGTVGLTIPISGRLEVEKARASVEHAAELTRVASAEWATRYRLREQWALWSAQATRLELLDSLLQRLEALNGITDRLAQAGAIRRIEARVVQIERASRQAERHAVALRQEELYLQLLATLGLSPEAPVQLVSVLDVPAPSSAAVDVRNTFAVRLARAEYEIAERALEREVRTQFPDITIGPGAGSDEGDSRVLFGLSLPIPLWNRNVQAVAEASAARDLAREQWESVIQAQTYALAHAQRQLEGTRRQRELLETTVVPVAEAQAEEARNVANLGDVDVMLLLDSVRRQHEVKLRLLDARIEEIRAITKLTELHGPPTEAATMPNPQ